jgi:hypothetical protein
MTDIHDWWKVVDDLSWKHSLTSTQETSLERLVITALFRRAISPLDKHGNVIEAALTMSRGRGGVYIRVCDVNKFFFAVEPKYVWKPRKKQGRPASSTGLEAYLSSGKLKTDAIKAARLTKERTGRSPYRVQVAEKLVRHFPDYSQYKTSSIEKLIRARWW